MSVVIVVVEAADGRIKSASLPGITAGQALARHAGAELHLLALGQAGAAAAPSLAASPFGATQVHVLDHPDLEPATAEAWADAILAAAQEIQPLAIGGTATAVLRDVLPRVAAKLDAPLASEVTEVTGPSSFKREISSGRAITALEVEGPVFCFTARASDFDAPEVGGSAVVHTLSSTSISRRGATVLGLERTQTSRPALTEADIVVSGGRGMREGKNFEMLETLTDLLGGALGASRAATDAGMVPADLQVGQTGKVVAPKLYVAVAISGAIQHLAGMKASKTIVAINKDPEAPIFQVADYGLVAKWEDALPRLIELIRARKAG